jgi:hypothetical protein
MFSSFQSSPDSASAAPNLLQAQANWPSEPDDVAFGCECADPSLQIDCWRHEAIEPSQGAAASA